MLDGTGVRLVLYPRLAAALVSSVGTRVLVAQAALSALRASMAQQLGSRTMDALTYAHQENIQTLELPFALNVQWVVFNP